MLTEHMSNRLDMPSLKSLSLGYNAFYNSSLVVFESGFSSFYSLARFAFIAIHPTGALCLLCSAIFGAEESFSMCIISPSYAFSQDAQVWCVYTL